MWTWIGANSRGNLTGGVGSRIDGKSDGCTASAGCIGCIGLFIIMTVLWLLALGFVEMLNGG